MTWRETQEAFERQIQNLEESGKLDMLDDTFDRLFGLGEYNPYLDDEAFPEEGDNEK